MYGVEGILIDLHGRLTICSDSVKTVFPGIHIQHCIFHVILNSTKFVSYQDHMVACRDLKEVYSAKQKWKDKYPMIQAIQEHGWNDLPKFLLPKVLCLQLFFRAAIIL
ncbi:MAG: transposase [Treponema sp.]|nr:transposase [Treponema sp.]